MNPQQNQEPRYISNPNLHYEQHWNPIPTHDPLVVVVAQESEDDKATPSVVKAPPLMRHEFTTLPSGGLTSEEMTTLAHGLTQAIIIARSNPVITPPPKHLALSNHIPYPPYAEDKTKKRPRATEHGEAKQRTCSVKDRLGPRIIPAKQRLGSRQNITGSQAQNKS